jgi:hypothetical protein
LCYNLIHLFCERNVIQSIGKANVEVGKRFPADECRLNSGPAGIPFGRFAHAVILAADSAETKTGSDLYDPQFRQMVATKTIQDRSGSRCIGNRLLALFKRN